MTDNPAHERWQTRYEMAYLNANGHSIVVRHTGSGWYELSTGDPISAARSRYRRKNIEQMTENLLGRNIASVTA